MVREVKRLTLLPIDEPTVRAADRLSPWLSSVAAPPSRARFELSDIFQMVGPMIRIDATKGTAALGVYAQAI
jgi:hypothetical protein